MGDVLAFLKLISPVLVGAVIGYFTNFIAIKMLFRPHKEYRIGKFRIPFTPGIIPKNRGRLAKAIGTAVGETLFTTNDLVDTVKNSPLKTQISDKIINIVFETDTTVESLTGKDIDDIFGSMESFEVEAYPLGKPEEKKSENIDQYVAKNAETSGHTGGGRPDGQNKKQVTLEELEGFDSCPAYSSGRVTVELRFRLYR